jgi:hypothetical protein
VSRCRVDCYGGVDEGCCCEERLGGGQRCLSPRHTLPGGLHGVEIRLLFTGRQDDAWARERCFNKPSSRLAQLVGVDKHGRLTGILVEL